MIVFIFFFFFSSRRRHTRCSRDWSSDVCSSDLGDDHLLSGIASIFEEHGFRLIGAHEIAPEILMPEGPLGREHPNNRDHADIMKGLALLNATSPFDVGQAAIVADERVIAIEAAEGTDHMLTRVAQ